MIAISDEHTIIRHLSYKHIDKDDDGNEVFLGTGFISRPRDEGSVSYNWLEYFEIEEVDAISEIRKRARLTYKKSHRLVSLNIGSSLSAINDARELAVLSEVVPDPLEATEPHLEDGSHCLMTEIPKEDNPFAEMVGDLLAEQIISAFPAIEE